MSAPEVSAERRTIPIFPLATVVLFPGADCPLHIFEPRYRQMTREARAGAGLIGMATVRPDHTGDMAGDPPVFPIGCLGRMVRCEELADGRFNVVLHGEQRFRIADEPPRSGERLYRVAAVDALDEALPEAGEVVRLRGRIGATFRRLVERVAPDRVDEIGPHRLADADDPSFVAALVQVLNLPPVERQSLLETNGVGARLAALESILHFQLAQLGLGDSGGGGRVH